METMGGLSEGRKGARGQGGKGARGQGGKGRAKGGGREGEGGNRGEGVESGKWREIKKMAGNLKLLAPKIVWSVGAARLPRRNRTSNQQTRSPPGRDRTCDLGIYSPSLHH